MTSETQNPSSPSTTARSTLGSLQALNLGSLLVGQLGQAINWGNANNFQIPDCKPWVELPSSVSNPQDTVESPPVSMTAQPASETQTSADIPAPTAVEETVLVEKTEDTIETEEAPPQVVSQDDKESEVDVDHSIDVEAKEEPAAAVSSPEPVVEQIEANQPEVVVQSSEPDSEPRLETPTGAEIKSEVEPTELAPQDVEAKEAIPEQSAQSDDLTPEPTVERPAMNAAAKVAPIPEPKRQPVAEVVAAAPTEPEVHKPVPALQPKSIVESRPVRKVPLPNLQGAAGRPPHAVTTTRPHSTDTDDAYLTQLERLVLELNMELARVRGEQSDVDPMEQMANRIIALNLENLALREQLQHASRPS
ncbi:hypothetical protein SH449x_004570 [Pirellulaceae bacterium SH449]